MGNNASSQHHQHTTPYSSGDYHQELHLVDALEIHPILKQYKIENPLLPGSGRMTRTYKLRHRHNDSVVVLKVLMVEDGTDLSAQQAELEKIRKCCTRSTASSAATTSSTSYHTAPFLAWFIGETLKQPPMPKLRPVFLLRPHLYTTLSDRLATRPWLTVVEKLWIIYQLLQTLHQLHSNGIVHGFLTTENIGLTSYNYLVLTDLTSCYKAPYLADDDPSEYLYYFQLQQTHGSNTKHSEKRCYLAPERFYTPSTTTTTSSSSSHLQKATTIATTISTIDEEVNDADVGEDGDVAGDDKVSEKANKVTESGTGDSGSGGDGENQASSTNDKHYNIEVTPAMDIFSTGCVLVELLLNGERCFDLGDLIEYRRSNLKQNAKSSSEDDGSFGGSLPLSIQQKLAKIESSHLRAACKHMLSLDPSERLSANEYWERLVDVSSSSTSSSESINAATASSTTCYQEIPTSSFEYLTNLLERMTAEVISPDARIALAATHYNSVLWETIGECDTTGQNYFDKVLGGTILEIERGEGSSRADEEAVDTGSRPGGDGGATPTTDPTSSAPDDLFAETEALLRQLEDFDLNNDFRDDNNSDEADVANEEKKSDDEDRLNEERVDRSPLCKSSLLLFLQMILATIRHVQRPASKLVALQLIKRLARYSSDEARLQRIVPVTISLLQDQDPLVRAAVIQTLTYTVSIIESFSPFDAEVFPQYIFKRVGHLISDPSLVVRMTFAKCLTVLAETAHRFLDIRHAVRLYEAVESGTGSATPNVSDHQRANDRESNVFTDDLTKLLDTATGASETTETVKAKKATASLVDNTAFAGDTNAFVAAGKTLINSTYNADLAALRETVSRWVIQITTDQSEHSALPKRSLLSDLGTLCQFFGVEGVMNFILPQIVAFLNDRKNWELRSALFGALPSVCHIIGRAATEEFVLPCVEIGLVDVEEFVITCALSCLNRLIEMNLLSRAVLIGRDPTQSSTTSQVSGGTRIQQNTTCLLKRYSILLVHPSDDIREGAITVFSTVVDVVGSSPTCDIYCLPIIRPYLRYVPQMSELGSPKTLRSCLKEPLTREKFSEELKNCSIHGNASSPTDGAWTSIGIQVREDTEAVETTASSPRKIKSYPESKNETHNDDPTLDLMREYLQMLARHTFQSPANELRHNSSSILSNRSEITSGIEGSVKLAQSIMFPRQDLRSQNVSIPNWYSTLRDTAEAKNSTVTEASAIRSVSALGHVYSLSIMGPPAEGDAGENIVGIAATDDSQRGAGIVEDDAESALNDPESKVLEGAFVGQWGSETLVDSDVVDTSLLVTKLKALKVPPLPPNFGELEPAAPLPVNTAALSRGGSTKDSFPNEWKPRVNALITSSTMNRANGHTAPVVRLAVSGDNSFFVSGSYDGTCRIWTPAIEDSAGVLESSLVYSAHSQTRSVRVNDLAMIESSHSVVSGSSDGSVHVWRVDMINKPPSNKMGTSQQQHSNPTRRQDRSKVVGSTLIRTVHPEEGEILAVSHFNTLSASVVTFGTQRGSVHSWDLRCHREPFKLTHGQELGYLTGAVLGNDRQWIVTGTSRGYIALWDVRFQQAVKLWRHSRRGPISRLATSVVAPPQGWGSRASSEGVRPFIFAACGDNECAMFEAVNGSCRECFRTITGDSRELNARVEEPPTLDDVPIANIRGGNTLSLRQTPPPSLQYVSPVASLNCMVGSIGAQNQCFLITGGSDSRIRFWDFSTPNKCYIVSGLSQSQPRPSFERIDFNSQRRLMLCRQPRLPGLRDSNKTFNGLRKPDIQHTDAIQDLKILENGALISCSRDCTVKVWR